MMSIGGRLSRSGEKSPQVIPITDRFSKPLVAQELAQCFRQLGERICSLRITDAALHFEATIPGSAVPALS